MCVHGDPDKFFMIDDTVVLFAFDVVNLDLFWANPKTNEIWLNNKPLANVKEWLAHENAWNLTHSMLFEIIEKVNPVRGGYLMMTRDDSENEHKLIRGRAKDSSCHDVGIWDYVDDGDQLRCIAFERNKEKALESLYHYVANVL